MKYTIPILIAFLLSGCESPRTENLQPGGRVTVGQVEVVCNHEDPFPTPDIIDPEPTETSVKVLDTWERPEYVTDEEKWKSSITRTLLNGQTTSVVLRSENPCELVSVSGIHKLMPVTLTKASAPQYKTGTYYDALVPLTEENCGDAKYMQLDAKESVQVGDAKITVAKRGQAPSVPTARLVAAFDNWEMVRGYCGNKWCAAESRWNQGAKLLHEHGIEPYSTGEIRINAQNYITYSNGFPMLSQALGGQPPDYALPATGWAYVLDEPHYESDVPRLRSLLTAWKAKAPGVKRLVTSPLRWKNLTVGSSTFAKTVPWPADVGAMIDVHVVVAEEFCAETWAGSGDRFPCREDYAQAGKQVYGYVSNMSHGSTGGPATGAPDLVIDARGGSEAFGFYLWAIKDNLDGLLYYNTIQDWGARARQLIENPWTRGYDGADLGGAGDGLLMYADVPSQSALPSIRLKLLREASQWADAIRAAKLETKASTLMTSPRQWDRDISKFEALHAEAMGLIE